MKIVAVVPDINQAAHMEKPIASLKCDVITVRDTALGVKWGNVLHRVHACDTLVRDENAATDERAIDDISEYLEYEIAVENMVGETTSAPAFNWPEIRRGIGEIQTALEASSCDGVVVWNDKLWYNTSTLDWAKKHSIPYAIMERGPFPGTLIVDSQGLDFGCNDFHRMLGEVESNKRLNIAYDQLNDSLDTLYEQPKGLSSWEIADAYGIEKPIVFIPLQVPIDTNVVFRKGGNKELIDFATQNDDFVVIAKMHPIDRWTKVDWLQNYCHERGVILLDAAIYHIISAASAVVTMNSQVGIDALRMYARVGVVGSTYWKYCGATFDDPSCVNDVYEQKYKGVRAIRTMLATLRLNYLVDHNSAHERIVEVLSK